MKKFLALNISDVVFVMLINVKMPTIVGILTFMSKIILCSAELSKKKSFIASGPGFHWCLFLISMLQIVVRVLARLE